MKNDAPMTSPISWIISIKIDGERIPTRWADNAWFWRGRTIGLWLAERITR